MNGDILVPIFLFGGAAAVLWKYFEGRNKERMAMIEKGVTPSDFKSTTSFHFWRGSVLSNLKWGLLFVFIGIGLLVGNQLHSTFYFDEESAIFGSMLISGGLALIIFYFIAAKKIKEEKKEES
jgi:hypothetical protein